MSNMVKEGAVGIYSSPITKQSNKVIACEDTNKESKLIKVNMLNDSGEIFFPKAVVSIDNIVFE